MSRSAFSSTQVKFSADTTLTQAMTNEKRYVKSGESFSVGEDHAWLVESAGKVPTLLVPLDQSKSQEFQFYLPAIDQLPVEGLNRVVSYKLSELLEASIEIQSLLYKRSIDSALTKLDQLQARYPYVDFLYFLRASALTLKGEKDLALEVLRKALVTHPTSSQGQELLKSLERAKK